MATNYQKWLKEFPWLWGVLRSWNPEWPRLVVLRATDEIFRSKLVGGDVYSYCDDPRLGAVLMPDLAGDRVKDTELYRRVTPIRRESLAHVAVVMGLRPMERVITVYKPPTGMTFGQFINQLRAGKS